MARVVLVQAWTMGRRHNLCASAWLQAQAGRSGLEVVSRPGLRHTPNYFRSRRGLFQSHFAATPSLHGTRSTVILCAATFLFYSDFPTSARSGCLVRFGCIRRACAGSRAMGGEQRRPRGSLLTALYPQWGGGGIVLFGLPSCAAALNRTVA